MKPLRRKEGPPGDNVLAFVTEAKVSADRENLSTGSALGRGKKWSVAIIILVAIIATAGWLYLIAKLVGALIHWL